MSCLISAFEDSLVTNDEVLNCKHQTHSTEKLDIKYPEVPEFEECHIPQLYPTTSEYKEAEFVPLPTAAKGKMDGNECAGLKEVNLKPHPSSAHLEGPGGCKCERITMNGPFSPGTLVKCVNCADVHRSTDINSCPSGTKLFSPRTFADWDTFLKSTSGESRLADPDWIIDITRPVDGCPFCTSTD